MALDRGDRAGAEARWSAMIEPILARPARPANFVPVLTLSRFVQAMQVAILAGENGMNDLSLRTLCDALKGGRPWSRWPAKRRRR